MNLSLKNAAVRAALAGAGSVAAGLALTLAAHAQTASTAAYGSTQTMGAGSALVGTNPGGVPDFAAFSDMSVGSRGPQVYDLQGFLSETGYKGPTLATSYFGSITKLALVAFQKAMGLPATGYYGSLTKSAVEGWVGRVVGSSMSATVTYSSTGSTSGSGSAGQNAQAGMSASRMSPLGPTGYWYNGNWYSSIPSATSTDVTGYWVNGTWTPISGVSASVAQSGSAGYWYNGTWYSAPAPSSSGTTGTYYQTSSQSSGVSSGIASSTSASGTYGVSTSRWDPAAAQLQQANTGVSSGSCGWFTSSSGTTWICR